MADTPKALLPQKQPLAPPETSDPPHFAEVEGAALTAADFDEFVYVLSHDLRASVRALAEIPKWIAEDLAAEGYETSESTVDYLQMMDTHSHRLDRMLFDLLTYSRVGRKQTIKPVSLSRSFAVALRECDVPRGFVVEQSFDHDALQIGAKDIVVLLKALLSNAIKHHDRNEGCFEISTKRVNNDLVLTVNDDGPGIPLSQRERIFKVMTTLRSRDEVEGSGMGLAVVNKIIAFYGGRLRWVDQSPDRGTNFSIFFPLQGTAG